MSQLSNISLRTRIYAGFAWMVAMLILMASLRTQQVNIITSRYSHTLSATAERQQTLSQINTAFSNIRYNNLSTTTMMQYENLVPRIEELRAITQEQSTIARELLLQYLYCVSMQCTIADEYREYATTLVTLMLLYFDIEFMPAVEEVKGAALLRDTAKLTNALMLALPAGSHLDSMLMELSELESYLAVHTIQTMNEYNRRTHNTFMSFTIAAALFSILIAILLSSAVQRPIKKLRENLTAIAADANVKPIVFKYTDEFGLLSKDISNMVIAISEANKAATTADMLDIMICVTTLDYKIVYANRLFLETFNADTTAIESKPCYQHQNRETPCTFCKLDSNTGKDFGMYTDIEPTWCEPLGKWLKGKAVILDWPNGQTVNFHYLYDATQAHNAQLDLESKIEKIEKELETASLASNTKSLLLFNTGPEIYAPLSNILTHAESALCNSAGATPHIEEIAALAKTALGATSNIIDIFEVDSGQLVIESAPIRVLDIVTQCVDDFRDQATAKDVSIHLEVAPLGTKAQLGDARRLRQIFHNLLSNSVKFTEFGAIKCDVSILSQTSSQVYVKFEFADSGAGIAPERMGTLFKPFVNPNGTNLRSHSGACLGLAITSKIVEAMGGKLFAESTLGVGSKFWFAITFQTLDLK